MGWGKYAEDIVSRWVADNQIQTHANTAEAKRNSAVEAGHRSESTESGMSKLKEFTAMTARPLPVVILADTSGSMSENGKIEALNTALIDMVGAFGEEEQGRAEIHVAIITFGGTAQVHQELAPASKIAPRPLGAKGMTPMGGAFDIARELIEDQQRVPGRAYTPALVLVSDGQPNDGWELALGRLLQSERAKKAQRFALGIGADADAAVLRQFLANPEGRVYGAADAREIKNFFRWVTMSVTARSRSTSPNASVAEDFPPSDLDELL
jgi:uncharacterized protein YegL